MASIFKRLKGISTLFFTFLYMMNIILPHLVRQAKKKICFYSILTSGHLNVCSSIATLLLDKYSDFVEIYFIVDREWCSKLSKIDKRFKFGVFDYDEKNKDRMYEIIEKLKTLINLEPIDRQIKVWDQFSNDQSLYEVDEKSEQLIKLIEPDLLLCDQGWHAPAMTKFGIPYAFICSCNPLLLGLDSNYPKIGYDAYMYEKEKIDKYDKISEPFKQQARNNFNEFYRKRGAKYQGKRPIDQAMSELFTIYNFPSEIDYYDNELKEKHKLWQLDSAVIKTPEPFELPEIFANLPGKIIYLSLGSLFSAYNYLLQRLIDTLDKLPYKYIVSKGPNGDKVKFPSNKFIGENCVDQLAILQKVDAMISHGGNNSLTECFHFGIPMIIFGIMWDQINNAMRIEETGFGYHLDINNWTDEQLTDRLSRILNDQEMKRKWRNASERINYENKIYSVTDRIFHFVYHLEDAN